LRRIAIVSGIDLKEWPGRKWIQRDRCQGKCQQKKKDGAGISVRQARKENNLPPLPVAQANNQNAILNAAQDEGEGPQSGRAQVFSHRMFAWVPPGFVAPGTQLIRGFRATQFNVKTRFKEKDNKNRDTFNVYLVGKTGGGEDFEWPVGVVVDIS
jgi:hypothetical protein